MQIVGELSSFHPADITKTIMKALRVSWMWLGVGMMTVAFFALLGALSIYNVSFVVPVTALSYITGAFGGAVFLRERIGSGRWLGILLVAAGVTLVFLGKG
jgi:drug/metabolite transporter (DMT)-like permease